MEEDCSGKKATAGETGVKWSSLDSATLTLLVWLVFFGFGGGLLAMYYAEIGYLPDLKWEDSLTYLAVLSILGGSVVVIYSLLLIAPGLIWSESLARGPYLKERLTWRNKPGQPCAETCCRWLVAPFAVFMLIAHVSLQFLYFLDLWLHVVPGVLFLIIVVWFYLRVFRMIKPRLDEEADALGEHAQSAAGKNKSDCKSLSLRYTIMYGLSLLAAYASLLIIYESTYAKESWGMLIVCTVGVSVSSMMFVLTSENNKKLVPLSVLAISVLLLVAGERLVPERSFSKRFMSSFGFGGCYTVTVTEDGRKLISGELENMEELTSIGFDGARIQNVEILSRLGSHYAMEQGGKRFFLPKKEVLSWATEGTKGSAECPEVETPATSSK